MIAKRGCCTKRIQDTNLNQYAKMTEKSRKFSAIFFVCMIEKCLLRQPLFHAVFRRRKATEKAPPRKPIRHSSFIIHHSEFELSYRQKKNIHYNLPLALFGKIPIDTEGTAHRPDGDTGALVDHDLDGGKVM